MLPSQERQPRAAQPAGRLRWWRTFCCAVLLGGAGLLSQCRTGWAQGPAMDAPGLKGNPEAALRAFEPALNAPYELGRGDEISIQVTGRPELSGKDVIGPDGKVTLPIAGPVMLADKTREQAAGAITAALQPYYAYVNVTVSVDKYSSDQVLLLGAVEHPGLLSFDRPPTLLEVVSRGGANVGTQSTDRNAAGGRDGLSPLSSTVPERCAIYRGSQQVVWVNLRSLLESGSPLANLRLKRDDIVYVPSLAERTVSILGEVQHPGALPLESSSTLPKLLALSGGLSELAGSNPQIQVIQPSTGKTRVIAYKQILNPAGVDLTLHAGDVIVVPESGFNKVGYVIEKLSPLVSIFTVASLLNR